MKKAAGIIAAAALAGGSPVFADSGDRMIIKENFKNFNFEPSLVAIEDHSDEEKWEITGHKEDVSNKSGVLTLAVKSNNEVRLTSKKRLLYGKMTARLRFVIPENDFSVRAGFGGAETNGAKAVWITDCRSGGGALRVSSGTGERADSPVAGKDLPNPDAWNIVTVDWTPDRVELLINGKSRGLVTDAKAIPREGLPVILAVKSGGKEVSLSTDAVTIDGVEADRAEKTPGAELKAALPKKIKNKAPRAAEMLPVIKLERNEATLENKFFKCLLNFENGALIKEFFNKLIGRNIISYPSRLFVIQDGARVVDSKDFTLKNISVEKQEARSSLHAVLESSGFPAAIRLDIDIDNSPEMTLALRVRNTSGKERSFGITCPVLENIKIGEDMSDDLYFYPFESGLCGGIDADLRHVYGFSLFMQMINVFNPVEGGGIYAFTKDNSGYPKIMIIRKKSSAMEPENKYEAIPWENQNPGNIFDNKIGSAMAWRHIESRLKPGEEARPPEAAIGAHQGDWHDPLRRYSDFAHSWLRKQYPTPRWYMDTYGYLSGHPFSGLHMLSEKSAYYQEQGYWDPERREYTYSKQMGEKEKNILMEWAFWWDYNEPKRNMKLEDLKRLGLGPIEAFFYGDYEYNKTRGGLPALREEIEKTHSNGGKISLYTFPCACAAGTKLDREHGKEWASMSAPGKYRHGYTQEGKGWNMCMYSQAFGAYMGERLGNVVRETGCDGCRLDVLASMLPCFNPDHSHHDGTVKGAVSPGDLGQVLTMIQKAVRSANPNAFLSTEHAGNDYLTQFTDGFFSENISWISESPRWAPFRALNMYSLVFTRFYFPEVKTWIHGPSDRITAIKMGLFNATGVACTHPDGVKAANTLRENSDALNSETPPEPYVDTLLEYVYANRFSCPRKKVWTIYNRSGKKTDQPILEVPSKENTHYMELLRDQPARAEKIHREVRLAVPMDDDDVAFLAELPVVISAEIKDDKISISLPEDYRKREGLTLRICYENDQADTVSYPVKSGVTPLSLPQYKKLIVKLFDGYYLVDEIALTKQP